LVQRVLCIEFRMQILIHCMVGPRALCFEIRRQILKHCLVGPRGFMYWSTKANIDTLYVLSKGFNVLKYEGNYWYIVWLVQRVLYIVVRRQLLIHCMVGPKGFMYWSTKANNDILYGWFKGFYVLKYERKYWYIVWLVQRILCIEVRRQILILCMVGPNCLIYSST
jgi:hypothetical protein